MHPGGWGWTESPFAWSPASQATGVGVTADMKKNYQAVTVLARRLPVPVQLG